jgi:hypothetical protein
MDSSQELAVSLSGKDGRQFKMYTSRRPTGELVIEVAKVGRIGSGLYAFRTAAKEPPVWTESGDAIRFADQSWIPVDHDEAVEWMQDFAAQVEAPVAGAAKAFGWDAFREDFGPAETRWQYATVNTGMFNTHQRLADVLGEAGRLGWELVQVYDKSSNWWTGMEKGFMLLRRQVPQGVEPIAWSVQISQTGSA